MKTVVFSDVHLPATPETQETRARFIQFLNTIVSPDVDRVIILGDLFDFWFEYRDAIFSGYYEVLRAFSDCRDRQVEFHLVCGNHDFWAGRFIERQLGFTVHQKPVLLDFGGRRVWLAHGDGENPRDIGYRLYKRIARAKLVIALFRLLHPDWAMSLARCVSGTSRRLTMIEDPAKGAEAEALRAYARGILEKGEADVVMAGHAHAPTFEEYPTPTGTGIYINSGDWMYHQSYVEWDGQEFRLLTYRENIVI